jgi:hypothetical protein
MMSPACDSGQSRRPGPWPALASLAQAWRQLPRRATTDAFAANVLPIVRQIQAAGATTASPSIVKLLALSVAAAAVIRGSRSVKSTALRDHRRIEMAPRRTRSR